MSTLVLEEKTLTSDEFLNILLHRKLPSRELSFGDYIFRGQHNANYSLVPSALRDGALEDMRKKMLIFFDVPPDRENEPYTQATVEYQLIRDFYRIADMQGLYIPESKLLRNLHYKKAEYNTMAGWKTGDTWLPDDMLNAAALAQHYGVPTRLLDWTYDPLVAAYFATAPKLSGEKKGFNTNGELCIWGLNIQDIGFLYEVHKAADLLGEKKLLREFPLKLITPPYHGNPNLSAQQGLFTHWSTKLSGIDSLLGDELYTDDAKTCLVSLIQKYFDSHKIGERPNMLIKITLPNNESEKVAKHLRALDYGSSKLFPGYSGANMEIEERQYFPKSRRK